MRLLLDVCSMWKAYLLQRRDQESDDTDKDDGTAAEGRAPRQARGGSRRASAAATRHMDDDEATRAEEDAAAHQHRLEVSFFFSVNTRHRIGDGIAFFRLLYRRL